jgi:hypothetical protein
MTIFHSNGQHGYVLFDDKRSTWLAFGRYPNGKTCVTYGNDAEEAICQQPDISLMAHITRLAVALDDLRIVCASLP